MTEVSLGPVLGVAQRIVDALDRIHVAMVESGDLDRELTLQMRALLSGLVDAVQSCSGQLHGIRMELQGIQEQQDRLRGL